MEMELRPPEPLAEMESSQENAASNADAAAASPPACSPGLGRSGSRKRLTLPSPSCQATAGPTGDLPSTKRHRGDSSSPAAADQQPPTATQAASGAGTATAAAPSPRQQQDAEQPQADVQPSPAAGFGPEEGHPQVPMAQLPDWCNRPLSTQRSWDDQEPFCILPGHPLLGLACEGQAQLLAKVLEHGADPDARDSRGLTALHLACSHARLACVKVLLEGGATQVPDRSGRTPVQLAAAAGHADVVEMVAQHEEVQRELAEQRQQQEQQQQAAAGQGERQPGEVAARAGQEQAGNACS